MSLCLWYLEQRLKMEAHTVKLVTKDVRIAQGSITVWNFKLHKIGTTKKSKNLTS